MQRTLLFVSILFIVLICYVHAVPSQVSFQGVLKDSAGSPVTGTRTVVFTIYGSPTGADSGWSETQTISVEAGLYSVKLGSVTPITTSVFDGNTKYLGISIGGSELLPRVIMVTVPYAYRAEYADTSGSSGGIPNAVLFNPTTKQATTDAAPAAWVSINKSGIDAYGMTVAISAETTGTMFTAAVGGSVSNPSASRAAGVIGINSGTGIYNRGVLGMVSGTGANGVEGNSEGTNSVGVYGKANDANSFGVYGKSNNGIGICGESENRIGVYGIGVMAGGSFESTGGYGVYGRSLNSSGVYGASVNEPGVKGEITGGDSGDAGVYGRSYNSSAYAVLGENYNGGHAVRGYSHDANCYGIYGAAGNNAGYPGYFYGGYGVKVTAQAGEPAGDPDAGTIFFNTLTNSLEVYDGNNWRALRY